MAVALYATDSISIFMGNGDGTFQPPTTIGLPAGSEPDAIVAGDFLGNGHTDLAVADAGTNSVGIILNNGDGKFQVLPPIAVGATPVSITEGDFENNGRIDLAVADIGSGDVTVLSNQGGGNFVALAPITLPAGGDPDVRSWPANLAPAPSTWPSPTQSNNVVDILQGNGDGTFSLTRSLAVGSNPCRSSRATSATAMSIWPSPTPIANNVSVLLGNGNGTFQPAAAWRGNESRSPSSPAISTATAGSTWPRETTAPTTFRCCSARATARFEDRPPTGRHRHIRRRHRRFHRQRQSRLAVLNQAPTASRSCRAMATARSSNP